MRKNIATISLCLLLSGAGAVVNAQNLNLNKGDEYKITTVMSSSTSMKRGDKTLDMKSMSVLTKAYKVTEATGSGYNLTMSITNIADTIDAFNQKLAYNTNRVADPASTTETALSKMVGEAQTLNVDRSGKVTQVGNASKIARDAAVAAEAGVYYDSFEVGKTLKLGANFKLPAGYATGTTWKETLKFGDGTINTTYKVEQTSANQTKVSFLTEAKQTGVNTNVRGAVIMQNNSGIVLQRVIKTDTKANSSLDGKTFITSEKRIISEVAEKVN